MPQNYAQVLEIAIAAARAAGALLREQFLRPGGPAGFDGSAEADRQAEELIRGQLLEATPRWGYLGEETGRAAPADPAEEHLWLVDPNDGTSAYLQGYRGCALSIALLRSGLPVLGVVYAHTAPDNEGDLFAWAEGCGPLRRNGLPVDRQPWAPALGPETTILLSQKADRGVLANLARAAPGRYRAEPSIAYRLALAAVGEGEAAVSVHALHPWDYAGGHALLRGLDGALLDLTGSRVTYATDGTGGVKTLFGGSPAILPRLAERTWAEERPTATAELEPFVLYRPARGVTVADNGLLRRAQGCLLGQLAGDALGSMVEFHSAADIRRDYPDGLRVIGPSRIHGTLPGQPTDDSELALMLARTLLHAGFKEEAVAAAYSEWYASHPFDVGTSLGVATQAMLQASFRGERLALAARAAADERSEANGALMRQSPLAIWGHALAMGVLADHVQAETTLTHPGWVCQDASAAYIVALAATIRHGLSAADAYNRACAWDAQHGRSPSVTAALREARDRPPRFEESPGHVLIALQNAFYQALHADTFEGGVVASVMGGGDTDTNAAIAGALLGAIHGSPAMPAQWREALLTCRPQRGAAGVARPRPQGLWPVDALRLAEALVVAGAAAAG